MSFITKNYRVEFIDYTIPTPTIIDITDFIVTIDNVVFQSTGELSQANITLNAEFGSFITDDGGGTTPIIKEFDRIRITILGDDGITEKNRIFEVTTKLDQLASRSSYFLPIELEGRERNISGIPFGGYFRSSTHFELVNQILFSYEQQLGSQQPTISLHPDSYIPDFNPNIWDFSQVDNCYDALLSVMDSLDLPVSAGGGGNRFALVFEDDPADINNLFMKIIIQGTNNIGSIPVLQQNTSHPITKIDKVKQAPTGTIVVARGRPKTATQPNNYTKFVSLIEFYTSIRQFNFNITYPTGSYVKFEGITYQANQDVPILTPPPSAEWTVIDIGEYVGYLDYSPLTKDKVTQFKNGFANPTGTFATDNSATFNHIAIPDHNLFINDRSLSDTERGTYRNWAMFRTKSVAQADLTNEMKAYMFDTGSGFGFYDGFQVLIDTSLAGTIEPPFNHNDSNGVPFFNCIARFVATPNSPIMPTQFGAIVPGGEWIVVRPVEAFDQTAVYNEAKVYEFNEDFDPNLRIYPGTSRRRGAVSSPLSWKDISNIFMGNECFHTPINVEQVDGLFGDSVERTEPLNDPADIPYIQNSAIKISFGYNEIVHDQEQRDVWFKIFYTIVAGQGLQKFLSNLAVNLYNTFATPNYTNLGWWCAWPTPYPFNTNGIPEKIGEIYGGDISSLNQHRYFDLYNIQYTTTGKQGWTHADSADLSEITGVQFLFLFDMTTAAGRIPFKGDIPFTYWCMDKRGVKWKSKKIFYRHLGEVQSIKIEFGDLSPVFPSRTPLGIANVLDNILVPEIEVNEQLFKDEIVIQGFQCESPYDEYGRYSPNIWEHIVAPAFWDAFRGGTAAIKFEGTIDGFSFIKTPVAISTSNVIASQRTIIPQFEDYPNIVNVEQLQRFADSMSEVEQFPYEQYTIEQGGINDLDLEDSILLHDPYLINENDSAPNTRLLTIREIHYSVPFQGGLIRKIVPVKVIDV